MNKSLVIVLFLMNVIYAQEFRVIKVNGDVKVLKGTSETFADLNKEDILQKNDLVVTGVNSFVEMENNGSSYFLREESALPLDFMKKMSLGELLLALAMEDIRNVPRDENKDTRSNNTAVYGSNESAAAINSVTSNGIGNMKINGAKWLAENGYKESAIILAKETYRKYPETAKDFRARVYFADLLQGTGLLEETLDEFNSIKEITSNEEEESIVRGKIDEIKSALLQR